MSRETVEMVRRGIRPEVQASEPVDALEENVIAMRGDLATARAQRDAAQAALDKANRDNDVLRAELREERRRSADMAELYEMADRSLKRMIGEREAKSLVDGGITYGWEDDEE